MDINLDDDLIEYLIFVSGHLDRIGNSPNLMIEYGKIIEIVESGGSGAYAKSAEDLLKETESDGYGDDFEEPKTGEEAKQPSQEFNQEKDDMLDDDDEPDAAQQNEQNQQNEGEGELDEEIDDEQMIGIAENCLIRIAEELLAKKMTIRQLFKGEIIEEEIEGEKIELLFPTSFLDGLQNLGITEFSDLENA